MGVEVSYHKHTKAHLLTHSSSSMRPPTLLPYHIPSQGLLPTTPQGWSWETSRESEDQITKRVVCFSDRKENNALRKAKCLGAFWTAVASLKVADKSLLKVVFLIVLTVMVLWSMCFSCLTGTTFDASLHMLTHLVLVSLPAFGLDVSSCRDAEMFSS